MDRKKEMRFKNSKVINLETEIDWDLYIESGIGVLNRVSYVSIYKSYSYHIGVFYLNGTFLCGNSLNYKQTWIKVFPKLP